MVITTEAPPPVNCVMMTTAAVAPQTTDSPPVFCNVMTSSNTATRESTQRGFEGRALRDVSTQDEPEDQEMTDYSPEDLALSENSSQDSLDSLASSDSELVIFNDNGTRNDTTQGTNEPSWPSNLQQLPPGVAERAMAERLPLVELPVIDTDTTLPTIEPMFERLAVEYNERYPRNYVPTFVLCPAHLSHDDATVYARWEVFSAVRTGVSEIGRGRSPWPRVFSPWEHPLTLQETLTLGGTDPRDSLQYPISAHHEPGSLWDTRDRVIFDRYGLYIGVIRVRNGNEWTWATSITPSAVSARTLPPQWRAPEEPPELPDLTETSFGNIRQMAEQRRRAPGDPLIVGIDIPEDDPFM